MKKILIILTMFIATYGHAKEEHLSIHCGFASRDMKLEPRKADAGRRFGLPENTGWNTALVVSTEDNQKIDKALFGPYLVTLSITDNSSTGEVRIVDTESDQAFGDEVLQMPWHNIQSYKGIEIPGNNGFTGLIYLNTYNWPYKNIKFAETNRSF